MWWKINISAKRNKMFIVLKSPETNYEELGNLMSLSLLVLNQLQVEFVGKKRGMGFLANVAMEMIVKRFKNILK